MKLTKRGKQISQSGQLGESRNLAKEKKRPNAATLSTGETMPYHEYIVSPHWRGRHQEFLAKGKFRCAFAFFLAIGKGKRYACHHMNYDHLGQEVYGIDVIILHPWTHKYIVHGILSGFRSASKQQNPYPNKAQRLFHFFCRLPHTVKQAIWLAAIALFLVPPVVVTSMFKPELGLAGAIALAAYRLLGMKKR